MQAGYRFDIGIIEGNKGAWHEAMKEGFERGDTSRLRIEILNALVVHQRKIDDAQCAVEMNLVIRQLQSRPLPGGLTAIVERADPQAARPCHGKIIAMTKHLALQQVGANKFVIHERREGMVLTVGKPATIACGQGKETTPARGKSLQR